MRFVANLFLGLLPSLFFAASLNAGIIVDTYGDKDGFGQGIPFIDGISYVANGGTFTDKRDAGDLASAPNTDIWDSDYPMNWTHDYVLDGPVVSALLEFYIAGFADIAPVDLLVDGMQLVNYSFPPSNSNTHILSVPVPVASIDGSTMFSFTGQIGDGKILDFAELTIQTRTDSGVVPEPTSLTIFGLAGVGLVVGLRRRRTS